MTMAISADPGPTLPLHQRLKNMLDGAAFPNKQEERLALAIADAQVLLKHAVESRLKVPSKAIDVLVRAINALNAAMVATGRNFSEEELAFWGAYEALSELTAPVTAESVLHSRREAAGLISKATLPYAVLSLLLFGLVVLCQWHWFDGTTLRQKLVTNDESVEKVRLREITKEREENKAQQQADRKEAEVRDARCFTDESGKVGRFGAANPEQKTLCLKLRQELDDARALRMDLQLDRFAIADDLARVHATFDPRVDLLDEWMGHWPFDNLIGVNEKMAVEKLMTQTAQWREEVSKTRREIDHAARERSAPSALSQLAEAMTNEQARLQSIQSQMARSKLRTQQEELSRVSSELALQKANRVERLKHRASQRIDLVEKFIIPILLGALGSVIYTLRSMVGAIRQNTYTAHFVSMSVVRISLGTIAGLLGVLIFPIEMLPGKEVFPLALPLLLGYSVEIFFTVMDRLVKAFTDTPK